ncbi:Aminopeptidase N, partial [Nestor notabilis]
VVTVNTLDGSVTQNHFLLDRDSVVERPSIFNYTWIVPITWMTLQNTGDRQWLTSVSETKTEFNSVRLLNLNVSGYFRVNYNQENWDQLLNQLSTDHQAIPVINRAQIIDDAFNLARAHYVDVTLALNTTRFLSNETQYMPWQAALDNLAYFKLMFDRSEVFGVMTKYVQQQVMPLFNHYKTITGNWTTIPSGLMDQYNEINTISTACSYGIVECHDLASDYFQDIVAMGGEAAWDFIWDRFKEAPVVSEADKLRTALTCSPVPWILNR